MNRRKTGNQSEEDAAAGEQDRIRDPNFSSNERQQSDRDQTNQDQLGLAYHDCWSLAGIRSDVQKPVSAPKVSVWATRKFQRNFTSASVVSFGFSSRIQCPVYFSTATVTSVATSFICAASSLPSDLSPPIVLRFRWIQQKPTSKVIEIQKAGRYRVGSPIDDFLSCLDYECRRFSGQPV